MSIAGEVTKHGALSISSGRATAQWHLEPFAEGKRLRLEWREAQGPKVEEPKRRGFGLALIENGLAGIPGAQVRMQFKPSGLLCIIHLPLEVPQTTDAG